MLQNILHAKRLHQVLGISRHEAGDQPISARTCPRPLVDGRGFGGCIIEHAPARDNDLIEYKAATTTHEYGLWHVHRDLLTPLDAWSVRVRVDGENRFQTYGCVGSNAVRPLNA